MKFININKNLIEIILSYVKEKRKLNLIKYNKKLMSKLNISLYTYQKKYFYSIISETLLENKSALKKLFDEETLNKLVSEFENDKTGIYENKIIFEKVIKNDIYNSIVESGEFSNLKELIIDNIKDLNIPVDLLKNLEKLYLYDVTDIKFETNDTNILLDKLKYLYLDNVSFKSNQKVKISTNNLIYFDLRFEDDINNENYNFMDVMKDLINIFNFDFLSIFDSEINLYKNDENYDPFEDFKKMKDIYKKPKEIFGNEIIKKLNYFYFEISYKYYVDSPYNFGGKFIYKYMVSKSISNKYIFEIAFHNNTYTQDIDYEIIQQEYRISKKKDYNDYFFIDKDMVLKKESENHGVFIDEIFEENLTKKDFQVNTFKIIDNYFEYEVDIKSEMKFFSSSLNSFRDNNNKLETIEFDCLYLDMKKEKNFFENLQNFKKLRVFKINKSCFLTKKQLITLFNYLSQFKYLFLIEINFDVQEKKPNFDKAFKESIYNKFPDIKLIHSDSNMTFKWKNKNTLIN